MLERGLISRLVFRDHLKRRSRLLVDDCRNSRKKLSNVKPRYMDFAKDDTNVKANHEEIDSTKIGFHSERKLASNKAQRTPVQRRQGSGSIHVQKKKKETPEAETMLTKPPKKKAWNPAIFETLYYQGLEKLQEKQKAVEDAKILKDEHEIRLCTFTPSIIHFEGVVKDSNLRFLFWLTSAL